jgi:hypothetical protein
MQQEGIRLIFYDLEKVHDCLQRKLLWQALEKAKVNQIIRYISRNNTFRIKIKSNLSDEFCNAKCLLQGRQMLPTLFEDSHRYNTGKMVYET